VPEIARRLTHPGHSISPASNTGLRPKRSDNGPHDSCPMPVPIMKELMIHCRSLARVTENVRPMSPRAGSIASMAAACKAMDAAIMTTNSRWDGPLTAV